jgi:Trypsin-co-occurring domain 1
MQLMPTIYVEVTPRDSSGDLSASVLPKKENFQDRAVEVADTLAAIAAVFQSRLEAGLKDTGGSAWALDEVELSFSIALEADVGVVLARASTKAEFEAKLSWKHA